MSDIKFVPQGNYVAATLEEAVDMTPGGIILAAQSQARQDIAKVFAVGQGIRSMMTEELLPVPISVGDRVVLNKTSYQSVKLPNGDEFIVFMYGDIFGIIPQGEN